MVKKRGESTSKQRLRGSTTDDAKLDSTMLSESADMPSVSPTHLTLEKRFIYQQITIMFHF